MKRKIQFVTDAAKLNGETAWFKAFNGEMYVALVPSVLNDPNNPPDDYEFSLTLDEAYGTLLAGC